MSTFGEKLPGIIGHARDRARIWEAISRFSIEPARPFYSQQVADMFKAQNKPHISGSSVNHELYLLRRFDMAARVPQQDVAQIPRLDRKWRAVWHVRTNPETCPEAWDLAKTVFQDLGIEGPSIPPIYTEQELPLYPQAEEAGLLPSDQ